MDPAQATALTNAIQALAAAVTAMPAPPAAPAAHVPVVDLFESKVVGMLLPQLESSRLEKTIC